MSIRVLLRDFPNRSIALVTASYALIFRHSPSTTDSTYNGSLISIQSNQSRTSLDSAAAPRCMVEFTALNAIDLSDYRTLCPVPAHGTLGLITINNDTFLCIVTGASKVASVRPGETVEKIYAVEFYCLNSSEHDNIMNDDMNLYGVDGTDSYAYGQNLSRRDTAVEHPCTDLQKLLSNGSFYYSTDFDLTNRLQDR
jgi:SacI homology domain